jgi:hypothetical protein
MKPIAWYDPTNGAVSTDKDSPLFTPLGQVLPLYLQQEWVGLTDEEIWETISRIGTSDSNVNPYAKLADARAIEAKLKDKNVQR